MMLAAADAGQYGESPDKTLQLALDCISWNSLPHAGGILDQPAGVLKRLRVLYNIYKAFDSMVNTHLDMKTWTEKNADMWKIVAHIERLRSG